ncbi:DUF2125 domain-containing protein [Pseudoroseomonas cervicalis]|uniref:DUF2125 domain-containing protein n=1 Tax=Teichococcus cervicalis TaxID=204525 RepID=UPI0022F1C678|nr:DUF2125 domain-containing protein [Pseudoroseomonas cervicalis]WBV42645.1 DUF2125 domain-containing protein [Pseudoroseomonas cervicalis]
MTDRTRVPAAPSRRRRLPRLLAGLVLSLAALHGLAWYLITGRLEQEALRWAEDRRAEGWRIEHGAPQRGGWPLAASITLPAPRLSLPEGLSWQAEALRLSLHAEAWDQLLLEPGGAQALRLGPADLPYSAARVEARIPLRAPLQGVPVLAEALRLGPPGEVLAVERLDGTLLAGGDPRAVQLSASGLLLPAPTPLGQRIEAATLDAALTGPLPSGPDLARRAAAWRDAGGALELRGLTLRWGGAAASAAATLALDAALQPAGAGTLRLAGAERLLDALVQSGSLAARNAALARALLPLMQRPDPAGGPPQLEVPAALENRTLSVARLNLLRLPELRWP